MTGEQLRVIHPTDFSPVSNRAFAHALRLAIATHGELLLLHLETHKVDKPSWRDFPHVRDTLEAWGMLQPGAARSDVQTKVGIHVAKFDIVDPDIAHGVAGFTEKYGGDLLVMGTEGPRRFAGSKAEDIFRTAHMPTLFVPAGARGFVDATNGQPLLRRVVAPVDHAPKPLNAIRQLARLIVPLGLPAHGLELIHIGRDAPEIRLAGQDRPLPVTCLDGPVVDTILARAQDADLIALTTEGRHGVLDALRGTTTERVLHGAPCPVLAIPA
ncbi:MAG: universal stress protein [Beijerinckiaceae bacterium]